MKNIFNLLLSRKNQHICFEVNVKLVFTDCKYNELEWSHLLHLHGLIFKKLNRILNEWM